MEARPEWISTGLTRHHQRQGLYAILADAAPRAPVGEWLSRIISSWLSGATVLPANLGLGRRKFLGLMRHHFPGIVWPVDRQQKMITQDSRRDWERKALVTLFLENCSLESPDAIWLSQILAEGCLGEDHLWQDLGLWSRGDLSSLLAHGFAPLARRNVRDMKWKKFFYRQLCEAAAIQLCQVPSCDACHDYEQCFGPEG